MQDLLLSRYPMLRDRDRDRHDHHDHHLLNTKQLLEAQYHLVIKYIFLILILFEL